MAETSSVFNGSPAAAKRCAVVTGGNKGIGFEICRQLASKGVLVVLTARDEMRGVEALQKLRGSGYADVAFHQLDVTNSATIASLVDFIKTQFGKLDILVNNAGISGATVNYDLLKPEEARDEEVGRQLEMLLKAHEETSELAEECLKTNYYGTKVVTEALLPLLQLSNSARIVNVSSSLGLLQQMSNERAKEVFNNIDEHTEERIDEVLNEFLIDHKKGSLQSKGWSNDISAYKVSKAAMNAYTRILARKFPSFCINCVCPGYVKTDITCNTGIFTAEEGAESVVELALLPTDGPSGLFFRRNHLVLGF